MSNAIVAFRDMHDLRKLKRERFGVKCPVCVERLPKAQAKILLPGQVCRAHKPHYRDPRPEIGFEEFNAVMADAGWTQEPPRPAVNTAAKSANTGPVPNPLADRDSDGNPQGGDGTAPSRSDDSAVA